MNWAKIFSLFQTLFRPIYFQLFSDGLRAIFSLFHTFFRPIYFRLFFDGMRSNFSLFHTLFRPIYFQLFFDGLRSNLFIIPHIIQTNIFPIFFWWIEIKSFHYCKHYSDQYTSNYFLMNWDEIFSLFHTLFRPIYFQLFSDGLRAIFSLFHILFKQTYSQPFMIRYSHHSMKVLN